MRLGIARLGKLLAAAWRRLRELSGDLAYDRYLEHPGVGPPLTREEHYLDTLRRRYSSGPNRCC
jgi:uncharacterized short protein YbdD (DUF466 family)